MPLKPKPVKSPASNSQMSSKPAKPQMKNKSPDTKSAEKLMKPAEKLAKFANKPAEKAVDSRPKLTKIETKAVKREKSDMMWVDKYKPATIKQIIGQQGAQSNMNKLMSWLQNWHSLHGQSSKNKPKQKSSGGGWGGKAPGNFKAALLSGPPGVGKTTTSTLVCKVSHPYCLCRFVCVLSLRSQSL